MATTLSSPPAADAQTGDLVLLDARDAALVTIPARRRIKWNLVGELAVILLVAVLYGGGTLLNFDSSQLQQTFEHNEAATLPVLTELGLRKYGVIPLWNPYMATGFPYAGDFLSSFWNPVETIPVWLFGGVNGYKISIALSLMVAGWGQWLWGYRLGLRPALRLWSALIFMMSGGLVLLWRLGWHQLLVGVVWFPWAFALWSWVCHSRSRLPVVGAALVVTMVLSASAGYYYFYLAVLLALLTFVEVGFAPAAERLAILKRLAAVTALTIGLLAVVWMPQMDVARFTGRVATGDPYQNGSAPIPYALIQYLISDPSWFSSSSLGLPAASSWFYIGALPLAALVFLPLAFSPNRRRRRALVVCLILGAGLLLWYANPFTFVGWVYRTFPELYLFRFPFRLLVIATSPILMLGAFGLDGLWRLLLQFSRRHHFKIGLSVGTETRQVVFSLGRQFPQLVVLALLAFSVRDVYLVNQAFGFTNNTLRNQQALRAIQWLHERDPSLYYVSVGDWQPWWWWTTYAYELEQPVINLSTIRQVNSFRGQQAEASLIRAQPKYIFPWAERLPENGTRIGDFEDLAVYEVPDALPFAFAVTPEQLAGDVPLVADDVEAMDVRWPNPNQLVVEASATASGDQLVALVSMFPGWQVAVDGRRVPLVPVNDYLGATLLEGTHTYTFTYAPPLFYWGLGLSVISLLVAVGIVAIPQLERLRGRVRRPTLQALQPTTGS